MLSSVDGAAFEFQIFRKGKRVDGKMDISSGDIGGKFAGKHVGVGSGDINVAVDVDGEGVDDFLPIGNFLYLVEKQIQLFSRNCFTLLQNEVVEGIGVLVLAVAERFEIQFDDTFAFDARELDVLPELRKQDGFAAASYSDNHFDERFVDKRYYLLQVFCTLYHFFRLLFILFYQTNCGMSRILFNTKI